MEYRRLAAPEVVRLREIHRRERIEEVYVLERGRLVVRAAPEDVVGFDPGELELLVARQERLVAAGGVVLGAFDGEAIAGLASVERRPRGARGDRRKMDVLYVSAPYRRQGVARALLAQAAEAARAMGASFLYVSATPTRRTVELYLRSGARLAVEPDPELLALEPYDIHLELPLRIP